MSRKKTGGRRAFECSFCNKSQHDVRKLIAGPTVYICDECVDICNDIIADEPRAPRISKGRGPACPSRIEIKNFLDEYVIGQDEAKKKLAVAVYNHYKRIEIARSAAATRSRSRSRTSC